MKKYFVFIFSFSLLVLSFSAAKAVDEATDSSVTTKIKERLEKTTEQGLNTIKEELTSQSLSPKKKAYVGLAKSVTDDLVTLEYKSQDYPVYLDVKTQAEQGDYLLTLGFFYSDKNQFHAKKILVLDPPEAAVNRQLLSGQIQEIDGNKITVNNKSFTLSSKTELIIQGVEKPSIDDLELKDNLYAIVTLDKNGDIDNINNLLVIPGENNPAAMTPTNATESALPATDSATIE
ncbi:MAG: hypothetical protein UV54_C0044G0006 [Candidatus Beckwithbacteria bacterium GW2011_GWA2_43_10]|uniref:DUF5666 domain-containing protein n=1 Tax=Candidatus Beckwithbacteria bacterium GW2011_GWA2_43_10 TaxID=1618369 RepID=A0A0G1C0B4_9BACT|nr:MAG: hypothetical protein UV54_C0044G0006 [Candidatus Beckwithbacteria bacterium GW2011_GWA2_43_10]